MKALSNGDQCLVSKTFDSSLEVKIDTRLLVSRMKKIELMYQLRQKKK